MPFGEITREGKVERQMESSGGEVEEIWR